MLQLLGGLVITGAGNNPLLATFAVFIALLLWFRLTGIVILVAASWIAVEAFDAHESLRLVTPEQLAAEQREREQRRARARRRRCACARPSTPSSRAANWIERIRRPRRRARPGPKHELGTSSRPRSRPAKRRRRATSEASPRIEGMPSAKPLRIASVNVNGVRAAFRKGMGEWLDAPRRRHPRDAGGARRRPKTCRSCSATSGTSCTTPPRPRAAPASRSRAATAPSIHRVELGAPDFDSAGRWLEADYEVDGRIVTVVERLRALRRGRHPEAGREVQVPRRDGGAAARARRALRARVVVGDLNVGHRTLDIRNWKGNVKRAGFLPRRARVLRPLRRRRGRRRLQPGAGLGWVDVGRRCAGEVDGPYTWWSMARQGVRQRHRMAHRLPARDPGARRHRASTTRSTAPRPTTSDGPTTPPSSSTTPSDHPSARHQDSRHT